jgi:hypothetical protein
LLHRKTHGQLCVGHAANSTGSFRPNEVQVSTELGDP